MRNLGLSFSVLLLLAARTAAADTYHYVDWTEADVAAGTAVGTITLPDDSVVTVEFAAIESDGSPGNLYGAQIDGGTNYWIPEVPYVSDEVENSPPDPDILQLSGGQDQTYEVTLSEAIKDPIMALVSLGNPNLETTYDFDAPFTIVSQGVGWWGGAETALSALDGDILSGHEGSGTIRFIGTFSTFSWVVPVPESWHGFTFGIRTTERIEPTPPAGEGGASGEGGAEASGGGPDVVDGGATAAGGGGVGGALDGEAGTPGTDGGETSTGGVSGSGGESAETGGTSSGGVSTGGTPPGNDGGSADEDDEDEADVTCSCSLPGASHGRLPIAGSLVALAAIGWLRRKSRRRSATRS